MSTDQNVQPTGVAAFFKNLPGTHNWLENMKRPFLTLKRITRKGPEYEDLFLNDRAVKVEETDTHVILTIPKNLKHPLFRRIDKE